MKDKAKFFDLTLELLCIAGTDGYFKRLNPRWTEVLGWTNEELCAVPFIDFVHPDDVESTLAEAAKLGQGGHETVSFVNRYRCKDGSYRWLEWTARADEAEGILLAAARDVTQHREAEDVLARFFESSLEMLCIAGLDGYFKRLNPRWSELLGYTDEELRAVPFVQFVHPDDVEATLAEAAKLGAGGYQTISFENRYRCRDGTYRWLAWTATAVLEEGLLLATARDITSRKEAVRALEAARDHAEAANVAKSRFLANMSHELRTPLNSVIGFSKVLLRKGDNLDEKQRNYLRRILDNGTHLLHLINDVLDLTKLEAERLDLEMVDVDVRALVRSVVETLRGAAGEDTSLVAVLPDGGPLIVRGDERRLRQVLINLVGNALKFTRAGAVEVGVDVDSRGSVRAIEVYDTGVGIPEDRLASIFEPFEQADGSTSRQFGGTGLGLAIASAFVEQMGYALLVDSREGRGSVFSIRLAPDAPTTTWRPPATTSSHPPPAEPRRGPIEQGGVVLVIDDDVDARAIVELALEDFDVRVVGCNRGHDALQLAKTLQPRLIVLDLMMPEVDGLSVLDALKADSVTAPIPVLVCSVAAMEHRSRLGEAAEVVAKPPSGEELRDALERCLSRAARVLIVEDDPPTMELLVELVERMADVEVLRASGGPEALELVASQLPELILLDLQVPDAAAGALLDALAEMELPRACPIVVVTRGDEGVELGDLDDRVSAVFNPAMVSRAELGQALRGLLAGGGAPEPEPPAA